MILLTSSVTIFLLLQILPRRKTKYSHKHLSYYLDCNNSTFIQLTDCEEVANIISTLNLNKASDPNTLKEKTFAVECFRKFRENKLLNIKF